MSDIDWEALLKGQQGQPLDSSPEIPLVTVCNEGAGALVGHEQFSKKDKQQSKDDNLRTQK